MSVYVDDMQMEATVGRVSGRWSHLWADTEDELVAFADRLGLRRSWIQRGSVVHYDVVESKRQEAIRLGAIPLDPDATTAHRRALRLRPARRGYMSESRRVPVISAQQFGHVWRWRSRLPERFGQACAVTARGRLNTIRVEFPDGFFVFTSRWAVRRNECAQSSA